MSINCWSGALCAGVVVLGALGTAHASQFYGVRNGGGLIRIDTVAQTVTPLGNIQAGPTTPTGFEDLEFDGSGNLYAIRGYNDGNFPPTNFNEAYRVTNPTTGASLLSASFSNATARRHANIAFRSSDGQFYSNRNSDGHLGTVSVTTGAFVDISNASNGMRTYMDALAIDPTTGMAYGIMDLGVSIIGTIDYSLVRMNLATGQATLVGSFGQGSAQFKALRFDSAGVAYTINYANGDIFTVNLNTGAASLLFSGGAAATQTTGLAHIIPGPAGAGLLAFGAVGVGLRRRRSN